ncbi:hypothetical protein [Tenacibaculum sp. M341]|uniref:hypothetical protein n=1 Tax=Tenacibaculum sp. M341 TaxID=2530339 RepID=UPI0010493583|nr:hypothetical protein [Tenacibaculum sp. M341]TCI92163.1 hypothetical protein EYW44_08245 [Tenacibaculum sp. M341]
MKNILKIQGIKELDKNSQKELVGGFLTEYVAYCGVASNGLACLTGLPHCPTGFCVGPGVCSPSTNG